MNVFNHLEYLNFIASFIRLKILSFSSFHTGAKKSRNSVMPAAFFDLSQELALLKARSSYENMRNFLMSASR